MIIILFIKIFLILIKLSKVQCNESLYEIYEFNNTYPRPILLEGSDVLALSGINGGYMMKYNKNGEVIFDRRKLFPYHSNADVKQLKGDNKRFVLVSGRETYLSIFLFNENGELYETTTSFYTNSFKISLLPLSNGDILIGWVNSNSVKSVNIGKFKLNYNHFILDSKDMWESDNYYISCIEIESNGAIICQYVKESCREYLKVFSSNLTYKYEMLLAGEDIGCGFDKLLYLGNDQIVATFLAYNILYFKSFTHSNYMLTEKIGQTRILSGCIVDTLKIDTSVFV